MSTSAYREVLNDVLDQVQHLPSEDQIRLAEELMAIVHQQGKNRPRRKHSIMELRGLGKELWRSIDVEKYIEEERNSWEK